MNRAFHAAFVFLWLVVAVSLGTTVHAQDKKTPAGEAFFIVASIDQPNSQLLLKHPTEVTSVLKVAGKTKILDENGKIIHLADLRTGDTVWVISSGSGADETAINIRKGPMSLEELHRDYLDYPEIR